MKMNQLDDKNKAALKRMWKLSTTIYTMNEKIAELEDERNNAMSDFRAELHCFPDAQKAYYNP